MNNDLLITVDINTLYIPNVSVFLQVPFMRMDMALEAPQLGSIYYPGLSQIITLLLISS